MAFWGVEVKPGKPYIHLSRNSRGHTNCKTLIGGGGGGPRLRLTQATIGTGSSTNRSVIQCNIGNKCPILLCSLLPDKTESSTLDLEFDEDDEVVFSVVGPRSIFLAGYYPCSGGIALGGDGNESDSYGEDIGYSDSDASEQYNSADDKYESDFIDDDDILESRPPARANSSDCSEEILDDEKPVIKSAKSGRLKKKYQVSDSDTDVVGYQHPPAIKQNHSPTRESEDDEGFIFSFFSGSKTGDENAERIKKSDKSMKGDTDVKKGACQVAAFEGENNEKRGSSKPSSTAEFKKQKQKKEEMCRGQKESVKDDFGSNDINQNLSDGQEDDIHDAEEIAAGPVHSILTEKVEEFSERRKKKRSKDKMPRERVENDGNNNPESIENNTTATTYEQPLSEVLYINLHDDASASPVNINIETKKKKKKGKSHANNSTESKESDPIVSTGGKDIVKEVSELKSEPLSTQGGKFAVGVAFKESLMDIPGDKVTTSGNQYPFERGVAKKSRWTEESLVLFEDEPPKFEGDTNHSLPVTMLSADEKLDTHANIVPNDVHRGSKKRKKRESHEAGFCTNEEAALTAGEEKEPTVTGLIKMKQKVKHLKSRTSSDMTASEVEIVEGQSMGIGSVKTVDKLHITEEKLTNNSSTTPPIDKKNDDDAILAPADFHHTTKKKRRKTKND